MNEWSIRAGARSDAEAVLALWSAAGSVETPTDSAASLRALLRHDPQSLLVADADGEVVGSLIAAWDGWRGSFHRLAVRPEHRRRGLASELVRIGEQHLRGRGAVRLAAIVPRDEIAARELWEALGYSFKPEHLRFIRDFE